ncbi:chromosome partitioning protein ParB (plasmid) [Photobacterium damselae subsp. damselae]|uniref:Chromosome (Plasmid) partitioning protein ParB n=1 Tax=Photobacterium damselae subsp. damselae TaxID=85581 RepID=E4WLG9_PHODD|nr:ParB family protein [Photobacterium damselae]QSH59516.1 chromosome partitioning protein ParB [Photobacterium damselae subsp. damselae]CBX86887.1 Chromosome (plasmid) partitioning protein ParB [Photobacterium damselae subsp. damselae]
MFRPQDKRVGFKQGNQLTKRNIQESEQKVFIFASGAKVTASRIVVPSHDIQEKTSIHELNPRCQASLSLDSVRDILPSIEAEGVYTEGVAIKDSDGIYQLIDSSRRRYCCLTVCKDLPLWVIDGDVSRDDLLSFIDTTQSVKRLSYRELGMNYQSIMVDNALTKLEELADYLSIGRETCRKRLVAASIDQKLINVFPDCEGIPNTFYAKLAKIEKSLIKDSQDIDQFIESVISDFVADNLPVEDKQKLILKEMEEKLPNKKTKNTWTTKVLADFEDKNTYAKVMYSNDKRGLKIELNRLPSNLYQDIVDYIENKIKNEV